MLKKYFGFDDTIWNKENSQHSLFESIYTTNKNGISEEDDNDGACEQKKPDSKNPYQNIKNDAQQSDKNEQQSSRDKNIGHEEDYDSDRQSTQLI